MKKKRRKRRNDYITDMDIYYHLCICKFFNYSHYLSSNRLHHLLHRRKEPLKMNLLAIIIISTLSLLFVFALLWIIGITQDFKKMKQEYVKLDAKLTKTENLRASIQNQYTELEKQYNQLNKKYDELDEYSKRIYIDNHLETTITKIKSDENKKTATIFFTNNKKRILKYAKNTKYNKYIAVAYALIEKKYGSISQFKKSVDKLS